MSTYKELFPKNAKDFVKSNCFSLPAYSLFSFALLVCACEKPPDDDRDGLNPDKIQCVEEGSVFGGAVFSCAISGDYAFGGGAGVIKVFKTNKGRNPVKMSELVTGDVSESVTYMGIRGSILYYIDHHGTHAVDISNPSALVDLGLLDVFFEREAVRGAGETNNRIVAARGSNHVELFDIANPAEPVNVGNFLMLNYPVSLSVEGNRVYVGNYESFTVYDISDLAAPRQLGFLNGSAGLVLAVDTIVYCGQGGQNLEGHAIVDARDLENMAYKSLDVSNLGQEWFLMWANSNCMVRSGDFLYVLAFTGGENMILPYDISNRLHPKVMMATIYHNRSLANQLAVSDDFLLQALPTGLAFWAY